MPDESTFTALGDTAELDDFNVVPFYLEASKQRVSVARIDDKLYAFDDLCTHARCPLSAGKLEGTTIMCQCHGSKFDLKSGEIVTGPATEPLGVYEVRDNNGTLEAKI